MSVIGTDFELTGVDCSYSDCVHIVSVIESYLNAMLGKVLVGENACVVTPILGLNKGTNMASGGTASQTTGQQPEQVVCTPAFVFPAATAFPGKCLSVVIGC